MARSPTSARGSKSADSSTSCRSRAPPAPSPSRSCPRRRTTPDAGVRRRSATREGPSSLRALALEAGEDQLVEVTWREGSRERPLGSRFLALRARPANVKLRRAAAGGELALRWLLCEWPEGAAEPVKYWLANLDEDTDLERLVHLAKLRWRIEHDYRELKRRARTRPLRGPLLPRLASPRDARLGRTWLLTIERLNPKSACGGLSIFQALAALQRLVACWSGTCPTCRRRLPPKTAYLESPVPT